MISEETELAIRARWFESIPEKFRANNRIYAAEDPRRGALIADPPPGAKLRSFFGYLSKLHLTKAQRAGRPPVAAGNARKSRESVRGLRVRERDWSKPRPYLSNYLRQSSDDFIADEG